MKKVISLILSMAMVLSLTMLSFADTTYTITIENATEGHTYEAYQIFTGDLSEKGVLSNIEWGSNVTSAGQEKMGSADVKAETLKNGSDAKAFAKELVDNKYLTESPIASATAPSDGKYVMSGLAPGYYLIKDKDATLTGKDDAYTSYIVKVVGNVKMNPKSDKPKVEKKVKDTNDTTGTTTDWQDSADYDIGDKVPFQLTATLPNNVSSYDKYFVQFNDTLSSGLTYNNDAVIKIDGEDVTNSFNIDYKDNKLTISCDDVIALGATNNSKITVEYTATLNENAVIGSAGNPNKVDLEYSNNPNQTGEGDRDHGKTPEDTVIVFTYKTVINKVDGEGNPLTGAEFTLEKKVNGEWVAVEVVKNDDGTTFTFNGLDDGEYRLRETKTPEGYNSINDIYFTITAEHDILSDSPALKTLTGKVTTGEITFTSNVTEGSLTSNVVNKSGATLPETGGIGTTIFYVLGSVLVIGAGILFVTKRRMSVR